MKQALEEQKAALIAYLKIKTDAGDWHAVQDAASDIREIDAKLDVLIEIEKTPDTFEELAKCARRLG